MLREEKYNDEEKYQDIEVPKVLSPDEKLSLAKISPSTKPHATTRIRFYRP